MIAVKFISLQGSSVATVKREEFDTEEQATAAVAKYAKAQGFSNVKLHTEEEGYRWTARTPSGRNGRNVAFGDFDYDE